MTQVSISVNGPTAGDITVAYTMSDTDGARILMAYGKIYGPVAVTDPVTGDVTYRPMTPTEIIDKLAQGLIDGVINNTIRQEQAEAAQNASAAVPGIPITPATP